MTKFDRIADLYQSTVERIATTPETWTRFLASACRNYKCSFDEQVLIYAQRPTATAVLEIERWNKYGRWVQTGTKGIAVFAHDPKGFARLKHYFDIADTYERSQSARPIPIWKMEQGFEKEVIETLENAFGILDDEVGKNTLEAALISTANAFVADNLYDYLYQLLPIRENSLLEELDDFNVEVSYRDLLRYSVSYMLLERCGFRGKDFFSPADFEHIAAFNTLETVAALGVATSTLAETCLREIAKTVLYLQNRTIAEQAQFVNNGNNNIQRSDTHALNLQTGKRLSYPEPKPTPTDRAGNREIRQATSEISERTPTNTIHETENNLHPKPAPSGSPTNSNETDGVVNYTNGKAGRGDRTAKSPRPNEMGGSNEQHSTKSRRTGDAGASVQQLVMQENTAGPLPEEVPIVQIEPLPTINEQFSFFETEDKKSSVFSVGQEKILALDEELIRDGSMSQRKIMIHHYFQQEHTEQKHINFIKELYGIGGHSSLRDGGYWVHYRSKGMQFTKGDLLSPDTQFILSWKNVTQRIIERIATDQWLTPRDKEEFYPQYLKSLEEQKQKREKEQYLEAMADIPFAEKLDSLSERLTDFIALLSPYLKQKLEQYGFPEIVETVTNEHLVAILQDLLQTEQLADAMFAVGGASIGIFERKLGYSFSDELREFLHLHSLEHTETKVEKEQSASPITEHIEEEYVGKRYKLDERVFEVVRHSVGSSYADLQEIDPVGIPLGRTETVTYLQTLEPLGVVLNEEVTKDNEEQAEKQASVENELSLISASSLKENYRITDDTLGHGSAKAKFQANMLAIETLQQIESDGRNATTEEQEILAQYVGWGGISQVFDAGNTGWSNEYAQLQQVLPPEEYASARESTLNAHYTSPVIIKAIYKAVESMGFRTGNMLEPSCGIGNFFGLLPESMEDSRLFGVELDSISGRIARQLYPKANIQITGYEKTTTADNFFDVAIGNIPFGGYKLSEKRYDKHNFKVHDHFFAKTLDQVRPGGIIAFITSKGTLDKKNLNVRKYLAKRAQLIGAIRLPNTAFKANAGTEVTSDIIFLQKHERMIDIEPDWVHLDQTEDGLPVNSYFTQNPDMVLGTMAWDERMNSKYGRKDYTTCVPQEGGNLEIDLEAAISNIHANISEYEQEELEENSSIPADPTVRNFSYTLVEDSIYYREDSRMVAITVPLTTEKRIRGMIELGSSVRELIRLQTEAYPNHEIEAEQERLSRLYDSYTKDYGLLNARGNSLAFGEDSSYPLLCSLEILDEDGKLERKADMFTKRTIRPYTEVSHTDTASEALMVSLSEYAKVDIAYMASLCKKTEEEVIEKLAGVIFLNPQSEEYITADEYLSGNIREKLEQAKVAARRNPIFAGHVVALEAVLPKALAAAEISVRLGATWIPLDVIQTFIEELLEPSHRVRDLIKVQYTELLGEWTIKNKSIDSRNIHVNSTYGTQRANAYKIIQDSLNLRDVKIWDTEEDANGKKTRVLNRKETAIAQSKQDIIRQKFIDWIWATPDRRERLCALYNERFNSIRPREYDGTHLTFPGMNPEISLNKHQVDAIARILYGGNSLLAHCVGAGKTFEMVAAAMKLKQIGLCNKNLIVVPNHLTEQWAAEFLQLYPSANILVATKKDFEKHRRKKFCARIATGDYDAIIMGHSQFEKIPMSYERQKDTIKQQIREVVDVIERLKIERAEKYSVKQMERLKKRLEERLGKLYDTSKKDNVLNFEDLGVDRLFIDEAHFYKNLFFLSKMRGISGVAQTEAKKSSDLFMKCRYLDEITDDRGTVFATGTPISNSMVELYTLQRYLQYKELKKQRLHHFDSWASTFGETVTAIELAPEGTKFRAKTRFAKFYNLPELMNMFRSFADIQTADMLKLPVPKANYHVVALKPSQYQKDMVEGLAKRAEDIRDGKVDPSIDNMLKITSEGRKLALDQRILNPLLPDDPNGKVAVCAQNVFRIWEESKEKRLTQLIFSDLSTPKNDGTFNVYDDMRSKLVAKGIPKEEIAFIHEAKTEIQKAALFAKVRNGTVRVLMGSTQKMGAGTNVQDLLVASHDLDPPWRPSDLEQRAGRIVRRGNTNAEVNIYRYVTEGTFDAYMYQLIENKQKFIVQIMTSKISVRIAEDVDEIVLTYAEIKALATGNPLIIEKCQLMLEVERLKILEASYRNQKYMLEDKIHKSYPQKIGQLKEEIVGLETDSKTSATYPSSLEQFPPMEVEGVLHVEKKAAGSAILAACRNMFTTDTVKLGNYRGFEMELFFDSFSKLHKLTLKGANSYAVELGSDIYGNITRIDNMLNGLERELIVTKDELLQTEKQLELAKAEVTQVFPLEQEYSEKMARLQEVDMLLGMGERDNSMLYDEPDEEGIEPKRRNTRQVAVGR